MRVSPQVVSVGGLRTAPGEYFKEEDLAIMAIVKDPEGNETFTLHEMVDFKDRRVLEIGCGAGRLTWRYADNTAHVTGIDPLSEDIETARANLPERLIGRVDFIATSIEDFATSNQDRNFDIALFSWAL